MQNGIQHMNKILRMYQFHKIGYTCNLTSRKAIKITICLLEILCLHESVENILHFKNFRIAVNSLTTCSGDSLALGFSKCGTWTRSISSIWELVTNANSWATPQSNKSETLQWGPAICFNNSSRFRCMLKFDTHCLD